MLTVLKLGFAADIKAIRYSYRYTIVQRNISARPEVTRTVLLRIQALLEYYTTATCQ